MSFGNVMKDIGHGVADVLAPRPVIVEAEPEVIEEQPPVIVEREPIVVREGGFDHPHGLRR